MRRLPAISACIAVLLWTGCGGFGDDEVTERVQRSATLSKAQVERHPEGSPERAFFEWWRALQYDNARVAARYYARSVGVSATEARPHPPEGRTGARARRRPRLVEADVQGDRAVVLTRLEVEEENANGRVDVRQQARAFNLAREGGEWVLAENDYLDRSVRIEDTFRREFERQQQQPGGSP